MQVPNVEWFLLIQRLFLNLTKAATGDLWLKSNKYIIFFQINKLLYSAYKNNSRDYTRLFVELVKEMLFRYI